MPVIEYGPITASENEQPTLRKIDRALENSNRGALLISSDGEQIQLPPSLFLILKRIVPHLTHGRAVTIVPINKEVTTQEAANILNVSRPYLVKLLEQGDIPFIKVGVHRRISLDDLMEYKERRDTERDKALAELTQLSQDLGLYD
ncbi:MAG TPA: helix-turn-helix domain-containing protein [Ktedonobacteraceae bacterium]|nr:helix-turn-helix domain-containing protein [Ktedonobacteraceae bacterium]